MREDWRLRSLLSLVVKAKGSLNALEAVSIHVIPIIPVVASLLSVEVHTRLE